MNIVIYTKSGCVNCRVAKDILNSKGIGYDEKSMDNPDEWQRFMAAYSNFRQMPQIFINDQRVGGLAGLQAALKQVGL
jgi:glutaredoxin 3